MPPLPRKPRLRPGWRPPRAAGGLFNKGMALSRQGNEAGAVAVYEELIGRYGARDVPGVQEHVASALINKALFLSQQGNATGAIAVYDELVMRYGAGGPAAE